MGEVREQNKYSEKNNSENYIYCTFCSNECGYIFLSGDR